MVRHLFVEPDQLKFRCIFSVVLQIFTQQMQSELLACIPAAEDAGIWGQKPLGQIAGCDGSILPLFPDGLREEGLQVFAALLQRLDVGSYGMDLPDGGVLNEQAVVDWDTVQRQHPVIETLQCVLGFLHDTGHMIQRCHHAVIHCSGPERIDNTSGMDQGNILNVGPSKACRHILGGSFGVAALDALITNFHA